MQLDISAKLTPQETTIICHHMKEKILLQILSIYSFSKYIDNTKYYRFSS